MQKSGMHHDGAHFWSPRAFRSVLVLRIIYRRQITGDAVRLLFLARGFAVATASMAGQIGEPVANSSPPRRRCSSFAATANSVDHIQSGNDRAIHTTSTRHGGSMSQFKPLALSTLKAHSTYARPYFSNPGLVKVTASALETMTDLKFVPAAIISGAADLETATQKMIARGVRSLLVVDADEDVIGIVTARDVIGDRAGEIMGRRRVSFLEIKVADVMTPADQVEVLPLDDVLHAYVGDIVETLKGSSRQHALVVEDDPILNKPVIRGIFSATQIARQLGIGLQTHELTRTFAEIERAIAAKNP
jgi:hypothetical protein